MLDNSWWWFMVMNGDWLNQHPPSPQVYKETLCWILADEWISMVQWSWWKIAGKKLWIGYVEHCRTNMNQPEPTWPNLSYSLIGNNGDSWWIHAHFLNSFKVPIINFASSQGRNVERTLASFCRRRMAWRTLAVCSSLAWPRGFHRRMGWWTPHGCDGLATKWIYPRNMRFDAEKTHMFPGKFMMVWKKNWILPRKMIVLRWKKGFNQQK